MSNWKFLNENRLNRGPFRTTQEDGFNGVFGFALPGEARFIFCMASDGEGWQHVSVSFGRDSKKCPSWEIMCRIKDLFWEPEDWVMQFHPAQSQYVNNHPGCLHLWRPIGIEFPVPDSLLVGFREIDFK